MARNDVLPQNDRTDDAVEGSGFSERTYPVEDLLGHAGEHRVPLIGADQPVVPDEATKELWREADYIWDRCEDRRAFRSYVSADYLEVYKALVALRGRLPTVLEWGSGLGVVAIMASNLGFQAYGIESEAPLVECSRMLAEKYGAEGVQLVHGTFIPPEYERRAAADDTSLRPDGEAEPGYDELDMDLRDFDLVYAYPWPEEFLLFNDILRTCGREDCLFLTYDSREGIQLTRPGRENPSC